MVTSPTEQKPDPFVQLSVDTSSGLDDACRELGWIADGGDPTATTEDRDLANLKRIEYDRERIRVSQRLLAYLGKKLSINPPSTSDLENAKDFAAHLARMRDVNVKATAVVQAATGLLNLYNKA